MSLSNSGHFLSWYVKTILPGGATLGLLRILFGFLYLFKITYHYVSDAAHGLNVNQSVTTVILNIEL